jgi:ribonuclease P protein component
MTARLLKRKDFLQAARGLSQAASGVVVQCRARGDEGPPRLGFTCTKKLGNAVMRNRIRRRLKEAARLAATPYFKRGHDYVLIGRAGSVARGFEDLQKDIISALTRLHAGTPIDKTEQRAVRQEQPSRTS